MLPALLHAITLHILVMDQSPQCWNLQLGEVTHCPCPECILDELAELPFANEVPCPMERHKELLETMIVACDDAYSAILRLESIATTSPGIVNLRLLPKIARKKMLLASLNIYDAGFQMYLGPEECQCEILLRAEQSLKRLHDVCVVCGYNPHYIWSFLVHPPRPMHTIFY